MTWKNFIPIGVGLLKKLPVSRGEKIPRPSFRELYDHTKPEIASKYGEERTAIVERQESSTRSSVTPEETLDYQKREIGKELYKLERHLSQGCRIFNKPCDCCAKHSLLEGLAEETIPIASRMGRDTKPYTNLIGWLEENADKFTQEAVESGEYDEAYIELSGEASNLRKEIMGTDKLSEFLTEGEKESIKSRARDMVDEGLEEL